MACSSNYCEEVRHNFHKQRMHLFGLHSESVLSHLHPSPRLDFSSGSSSPLLLLAVIRLSSRYLFLDGVRGEPCWYIFLWRMVRNSCVGTSIDNPEEMWTSIYPLTLADIYNKDTMKVIEDTDLLHSGLLKGVSQARGRWKPTCTNKRLLEEKRERFLSNCIFGLLCADLFALSNNDADGAFNFVSLVLWISANCIWYPSADLQAWRAIEESVQRKIGVFLLLFCWFSFQELGQFLLQLPNFFGSELWQVWRWGWGGILLLFLLSGGGSDLGTCTLVFQIILT